MGSPLRMQRVQILLPLQCLGLRITSAHAESTIFISIIRHIHQDHLCACREYLTIWCQSPRFTGSPLRMQRVLKQADELPTEVGITSAHAESTVVTTKNLFCHKDHLCACREYFGNQLNCVRPSGSPLRMQRVQNMLRHNYPKMRITSAHAESTAISASITSVR